MNPRSDRVPVGRYIVIGVAIAFVITAVAGGLVLLGTPAEERARRLDNRRVGDLVRITRATDLYWMRHQQLPVSLDELSREPGIGFDSRDPGTSRFYDYRVLDAKAYGLCAVFERDSGREFGGAAGDFWSHGAGKWCFQLKVGEAELKVRPTFR